MAGIWRKSLVYLGLVEEEEHDNDFDERPDDESRRTRSLHKVEETPRGRADAVVRPIVTTPRAHLHLVHPSEFNDAQELADKYRDGQSVIMNLQSTDPDLGRRLIDFASGLVYGLGGAMQPIAERVFLLAPAGVQISAEERRRFLEERGFFNQA
jgi:cell division inhibitor SepF